MHIEIICLELSPPLNGSVEVSAQLLGVGTAATYSCDQGYILVGETARTCEDANGAIGVWNGSMPSCEGTGESLNTICKVIINNPHRNCHL